MRFGSLFRSCPAIAVLACLAAAACGEEDAARVGDQRPEEMLQCGDERAAPGSHASAIVNGSPEWDGQLVALSPGQALAVGALMQESWGGFGNVCTATLFAPGRVLTAAHCVRGRRGRTTSPEQLRFAVGPDVDRPLASFEVSKVVSHPDYDPRAGSAAHDLAVLILERQAVEQAQALDVRPIPYSCLPLEESGFVGSRVQTVGYGATDVRGQSMNTRQWWAVEEAVALSGFDFTLDGNGEAGVCYGDSGGPTLWTTAEGVRIVGTLSWGDELCGRQDHFARTDAECAFLDQNLPPCGQVTAQGSCEGTLAVYCEADAVVRRDCAGQGEICADDGTGSSRCLPDPCGEETPQGRCADGEAIWCEVGATREVRHERCRERGEICADDGTGRMRCGPDPCAGETAQGRCVDGEAIWCAGGATRELRQDRCRERGEICADDGGGRMRCQPDPCVGEIAMGRCQGTEAIWCEGGRVRVRRCAECGQVCGWSEPHAAFYCLGGGD